MQEIPLDALSREELHRMLGIAQVMRNGTEIAAGRGNRVVAPDKDFVTAIQRLEQADLVRPLGSGMYAGAEKLPEIIPEIEKRLYA